VFVPLEVSTSIIPELVATTVAGRAGMQFLTGLSGDMSWTKKVSGVTGQWLDTESEQEINTETLVFGSVRATQHPYAAAVPLTWLMLRQPAIAMEAVVRQDLVEKLGLLLDLGAIKGLGQQGQPRGVDLWPDVSTESWSGTQFGSSAGSGGDTTYDTSLDKLRNMHFDLENADALGNGQSLAWIAEPSVAHKLSKTTNRDGDPMYLTKDQPNIRTLLGYPLITSTAMSNADTADGFLMFGKWNEAILASWGGMEFAISDSHASNFLTGVVVIRAISSADVVVRQPKAFTSATALTTT
jgi:HK97 family phage major capsid protein